MTETIKLDGRKFHGVSQALTANQDNYILARLRLSGAMEILHDVDGVKRSQEQRAQDLLTRILLSDHYFHVVSGALTEDGKLWNRKDADTNAERFSAITDAEEKSNMRTAIVSLVIGFFSSGAPSSETSPKSSSRNGKAPSTKSAAATSGTSHR